MKLRCFGVGLALLLALAKPAAALTQFGAYEATLSPTHLYDLGANANDSGSSPINGVNSGGAFSGTGLSAYAGGYTPTSSGYITLPSISLTSASGWTIVLGYLSTSSASQVALFNAVSPTTANAAVNFQQGPSSCGGTSMAFIINVSGSSSTIICGSGSNPVNDGFPHLIVVDCFSGTCSLRVDTQLQGTVSYSISTYGTQDYSIGNYVPSPSFAVVGAVGGLAYFPGGIGGAGASTLSQQQALLTCLNTGNCGSSPGCPTITNATQLFCLTADTYTGGTPPTPPYGTPVPDPPFTASIAGCVNASVYVVSLNAVSSPNSFSIGHEGCSDVSKLSLGISTNYPVLDVWLNPSYATGSGMYQGVAIGFENGSLGNPGPQINFNPVGATPGVNQVGYIILDCDGNNLGSIQYTSTGGYQEWRLTAKCATIAEGGGFVKATLNGTTVLNYTGATSTFTGRTVQYMSMYGHNVGTTPLWEVSADNIGIYYAVPASSKGSSLSGRIIQ